MVHLPIKVVPGSRSDAVVGMLGERLKVKVVAAPEHGRANRAACDLLADFFRVPKNAVRIIGGHSSPEKIVAIDGITEEEVRRRIASG